MADYPNDIFTPRTIENLPGVEYDPSIKKRHFAEDHQLPNAETVAIEEELGLNPKADYATVAERLDNIEDTQQNYTFLKTDSEIYNLSIAQIITAIHTIIGTTNIVGLWFYDALTGTTITDRSGNARNMTLSTEAADLTKGNVGTSRYIYLSPNSQNWNCGDSDAFSFGNGTTDSAFSIITFFKPTSLTNKHIFAKYDITTGAEKREYRLAFNASDRVFFRLTDNSNAKYIGRLANYSYNFTSQYNMITATYNGNASTTGIKIYLNNTQIDDYNETSGGYVAMENTAAVLAGYNVSTSGAVANAVAGNMVCNMLFKKELTTTEIFLINNLLQGISNQLI